MEIILQETDEDILDILTIALQLAGFEVYAVLNYNDNFIGLIEQLRPHVVMLDYRLDGKLCVAMCEQIKEKHPHLPVIAMSCNSNINEEYDRNGFDDYIQKPFDLDVLYELLRRYIPRQIPEDQ